VENYFNYFTEIEEHFCRQRGTLLHVSPLDWDLIRTWKEAGIPLEAVLRGIDLTFERFNRRPSKTRKINGLGWCTQEVLAAAEGMKEAAVGSKREESQAAAGLDAGAISSFLLANAKQLRGAETTQQVQAVAAEVATTLENLAAGLKESSGYISLEDLERHLTVLEEKILAALTVATPEAELLSVRAEADREIMPYRGKMPGAQIAQLQKQFLHRRLLEKTKLPRLSLFYL
jgi:hypothetical protein